MSGDLVQWLRDQLDIDERIADAAAVDEQYFWNIPERPAEVHVNRWSPVRVLADVDAGRQLLRAYDRVEGQLLDTDRELSRLSAAQPVDEAEYVAVKTFGVKLAGRREGLETAIRLRAMPYADRPGYQEKWRP